MMVTEKLIRKVIAEELNLELNKIVLEASIIDDLGADSLDGIQILLALEYEFELSIPDDDAMKMQTVKNVVDYILEKAG